MARLAVIVALLRTWRSFPRASLRAASIDSIACIDPRGSRREGNLVRRKWTNLSYTVYPELAIGCGRRTCGQTDLPVQSIVVPEFSQPISFTRHRKEQMSPLISVFLLPPPPFVSIKVSNSCNTPRETGG